MHNLLRDGIDVMFDSHFLSSEFYTVIFHLFSATWVIDAAFWAKMPLVGGIRSNRKEDCNEREP